ncbi:MAG TPA: Rrf2 family transcriptional regulator [Candidatus Dormibacteraeota bacterium]|nr:Rrf2 family transcriptional regulator [Candidatus Dormibacteraeota bacterium]
MKLELTRRGDYAIRAMLALGRAPGERLSTPTIAAAMGIPVRFLPQVMGDLARAGLVTSQPGRNGGYRLARPAERISMLSIIEAVEGDSRRRTCVLRGGPCRADGACDVHDVFFAAQDRLLQTLAEATLASVAVVPSRLSPGPRSGAGGTASRGRE